MKEALSDQSIFYLRLFRTFRVIWLERATVVYQACIVRRQWECDQQCAGVIPGLFPNTASMGWFSRPARKAVFTRVMI
jgi:hypothetical protein